MRRSLLDVPSHVAASIPAKLARLYCVVPIYLEGRKLTLAVPDENDYRPRADIAALCNLETSYIQYPIEELRRAVEVLYSEGPLPAAKSEDSSGTNLDPEALANAAPTVRLVNTLLTEAVLQGASDIHLEPFRDRVVVRFRIDSILIERPTLTPGPYLAVVSRVKLMANLNIAEKRLPQDGRFTIATDAGPVDVRVTVSPVVFGECVAIRLLNQRGSRLSVEQLGVGMDGVKLLRKWTARGNGIVLITGPTGSGKTTTLYATLGELATTAVNIVTIEDPVEYQMDGVNQMEAKPAIGFGFAQGLRTILRMDPDIIMVGEIRDKETAQIAVQSALTGHLVLSTLHTNNAPSTIIRLQDMGVDPFLVASTVRGIAAQRLVRVLCEECRTVRTLPRLTLLAMCPGLGPYLPAGEEVASYGPVGCTSCHGTGFRGRTGIYELMDVTDELTSAISRGESERELRRIAVNQGMVSLLASGLSRVLDGTTSFEELLRVTQD